MKFDLFKLHVSKEDIGARSYIKVFGKELFNNIKIMINDVLKSRHEKITHLSKRIAKKLNIHYDTVLKMLRNRSNRKGVALSILIELLNEWKINCNKSEKDIINKKLKLQNYFEKLGCGSKEKNEVKPVKKLDITLAKIAGAHMADGHLLKEKTFGGFSYKIIILDGYKNNLEAFSKWIKSIFGINVKVKKLKCNAWKIDITNKIIGRYLELFFGFPSGVKTYYNLPKAIENSSKEIKRAFVVGLFSFDACVETDKTISYGIANKILRDQAGKILKESDLEFTLQKKTKYYHLKTSVLDKNKLKKWLNFFEPNTEKWFKIVDVIKGFDKRVSSFNEAVFVFSTIYKDGMKTNIPHIISTLKKLKICDKYILAKKLNVGVSTLYRYIHILENANILTRTKDPNLKNKLIFLYNPNIKEWKVPYRPYLTSHYL